MSDLETVDERLRAVERALTDRDELPDDIEAGIRRRPTKSTTDLAARVDELETRLDELDAAVQALRGYVGNIRAVNDNVERRADAALAKAEMRQQGTNVPSETTDVEVTPETESALQRPPADDESGNGSLVTRLREVL